MPRDSVVDVPEHVIQRINNRQVFFVGDGDMKTFITWFKEYAHDFLWLFMLGLL